MQRELSFMHSPGEIQRHKHSPTHRQHGDGAAFVSWCQPGLVAEGTALAVPRALSHSQSSPNTVQVLWSHGLSPKPPLSWAQLFPIKRVFFFSCQRRQIPSHGTVCAWSCWGTLCWLVRTNGHFLLSVGICHFVMHHITH